MRRGGQKHITESQLSSRSTPAVGRQITRVLGRHIDAATRAFFDSLARSTIADQLRELKRG